MCNPLSSYFPIEPERLQKLCDARIDLFKKKMEMEKVEHDMAVLLWEAQDKKHSKWDRFVDAFRDHKKIRSKPLWHDETKYYSDASQYSRRWRAYEGGIEKLKAIKHRAGLVNGSLAMVYLNHDDTDYVHGSPAE
jgi:hypothetical protein